MNQRKTVTKTTRNIRVVIIIFPNFSRGRRNTVSIQFSSDRHEPVWNTNENFLRSQNSAATTTKSNSRDTADTADTVDTVDRADI